MFDYTISFELNELIRLRTLVVLEIERIEEKNELDEYDKEQLYFYKNILEKIEDLFNK